MACLARPMDWDRPVLSSRAWNALGRCLHSPLNEWLRAKINRDGSRLPQPVGQRDHENSHCSKALAFSHQLTQAPPASCRAFFVGLGNGSVLWLPLSFCHHSPSWSLLLFSLPLDVPKSHLHCASSTSVVPGNRQALASPHWSTWTHLSCPFSPVSSEEAGVGPGALPWLCVRSSYPVTVAYSQSFGYWSHDL